MTVRLPLSRLLFLLLMWIIVSVCGCWLILLEMPPTDRSTPLRTRPPAPQSKADAISRMHHPVSR